MKKIDWFWFLLGTAFLVMSVVFIIRGNDWFIIFVNVSLGILWLFKSYYQERMSISHWLGK